MKIRGGWGLAVLAMGLLALAAAPAVAQDECVACHEDVVKGFAKSSHGRTFAADKDYQGSSCTSCHTDAREHAESGGDKKPLSLTKGATAEANASCLSCHAGHKKQALWEGSAHQLAGLKCASCHDVHKMHIGTPEQQKTLPGRDRDHEEVPRVPRRPAGEPAPAFEPPDARRADGVHLLPQPARDGGREAHRPGLGERALLLLPPEHAGPLPLGALAGARGLPAPATARTARTTRRCSRPASRSSASPATSRGGTRRWPGYPAAIWQGNKACLNCHQNIHGSNHPSGPLFQR